MKKKEILFNIILLFSCSVNIFARQSQIPIYQDETKPIEERIEDALSRLTLEEKIGLIHAQSKFSSKGVPRLGIPDIWCTDGPHGIRAEVLWDEWKQAQWTNDSCTAFPALTCLAATWDPDMAGLYGKCIGEEARYRNKNVLLGPGVNIYRTPLNGRNFEYMGEDPFLASKMVVPYIQGVQGNGVAACVKHYALNNNEVNRHTTNVIINERALHEIYLPAFKAAVREGNAWSIMGAYNLYKDQYCCHNEYLLNDILKKEWEFDGVVISDWGGTHDTQQSIENGLDLEFGSWTNGLNSGIGNAYNNYYLANPYLQLIKSGKTGTEELDDKVRRVLRLIFRTTMNSKRPYGSFASPEHFEAARKIGEQGIVLLQNKNNILPLKLNTPKVIAVIGENAIKMMTVGGGSSSLKAHHEVSPLEGLKKRLNGQAKILYARGYVGDDSGEYDGVITGQNLKESRSEGELIKEAIETAKKADYVIFIGGLNKSGGQDCEGSDRSGLELPYEQNKVINELIKVNKNIIVINISGNAVSMPWVNDVSAIVQAWYLGSEAGNALASILTGDVNPSGKLPFTFPVTLDDVAAHKLNSYPGVKRENSKIIDEEYKESIYIGYRWVEKEKIKPLFAFGHGLSYTTFKYGNISLSKNSMNENETITITLPITNTGSLEGSEIVQLYISDKKSSLPRPIKELKGFEKVRLAPGETKVVSFIIDKSLLSYYDDSLHKWIAEPGKFEVIIGASSEDIKDKAVFYLN